MGGSDTSSDSFSLDAFFLPDGVPDFFFSGGRSGVGLSSTGGAGVGGMLLSGEPGGSVGGSWNTAREDFS